MRRRRLPPWRRLLLEYAAMVAVFYAIFYFTDNWVLAVIVMIAASFLLRATRPKPGQRPPPGGP